MWCSYVYCAGGDRAGAFRGGARRRVLYGGVVESGEELWTLRCYGDI